MSAIGVLLFRCCRNMVSGYNYYSADKNVLLQRCRAAKSERLLAATPWRTGQDPVGPACPPIMNRYGCVMAMLATVMPEPLRSVPPCCASPAV